MGWMAEMHRRKREKVKELLTKDSQISTSVICKRIGCYPAVVRQVKEELKQKEADND